MIDTPHLTTTAGQHTAIIHLQIPMAEMMKVFGPTTQELIAAITAQGISPAGPVFAHHLDLTGIPERFDFELSVPVATPVTAAGRMRPGIWPVQRVARTLYCGGYEGLPEAWGEFMDWIAAEGHKPAEDLYEAYVTGPHSDPDPGTWTTELTRPLLA